MWEEACGDIGAQGFSEDFEGIEVSSLKGVIDDQRVFETAAVLEVGGDAGDPERVTALKSHDHINQGIGSSNTPGGVGMIISRLDHSLGIEWSNRCLILK